VFEGGLEGMGEALILAMAALKLKFGLPAVSSIHIARR
jgi:hypothetical protein